MATDDEAGLLAEQIAKGTEVLSGAAEALLFVLNRRTAELAELKKRLESGGNIPALLKERDELVSCVENLKSRLESVAPEKVREVSSPGELLRVAADVAESYPLADPGREESLGREIARAVDSHIAAYPVLGPLRLALLSLLSAAVRKEFRAKRRHHIRRADYERAVEFIRRYALPKPDQIGEPALELLRIRAKLGLSAGRGRRDRRVPRDGAFVGEGGEEAGFKAIRPSAEVPGRDVPKDGRGPPGPREGRGRKEEVKLMRRALFVPSSLLVFVSSVASAQESYGGVALKDPATLGEKVTDIVRDVGMPLGGAVLFFSVCAVAIQIMLSRINPEKRSEAMSGLMYVVLGGALLGGAMFIAGAILGLGQKF